MKQMLNQKREITKQTDPGVNHSDSCHGSWFRKHVIMVQFSTHVTLHATIYSPLIALDSSLAIVT